MATKLTLTIDDATALAAKKYARKKGKSLSFIIENYLKSVSTAANSEIAIHPRVKKLMGSVKLPKDFDYKTELKKAVAGKHKL
jgi:Family of unknown function (DUF6364)